MTRLLAVMIPLFLTSAAVPGAAGSQPMTQTVTLSIHDFAYDPVQTTIPHGTTVIWTNRDDMPHTITEDTATKTFSSDALDTGDTFSYRFDAAGRFSYFCALHPRMQGVVLVR